MRIAITGSTGLVGTALVEFLSRTGHAITRIVRMPRHASDAHHTVAWNPETGELDAVGLEGHDVIIHLAGENISSGRWTAKRKARIYESRVQGTSLLCKALVRLKQPPRVLLSASAVGYYGNRDPAETIDEGSGAGSGFLADVCRAWEEATRPAEEFGIRVVHMRFGMILAPIGGALGKMLPAFRLGLGGRIGSGEQMMSWVALDDIPPMMMHAVEHSQLAGPVNFVAPKPVSNTQFTKALGEALGRPTVMPLPAFAMKGLFGEMAEELLLGGAKVIPRKLLDAGYRFSYSEIGPALHHLVRQA